VFGALGVVRVPEASQNRASRTAAQEHTTLPSPPQEPRHDTTPVLTKHHGPPATPAESRIQRSPRRPRRLPGRALRVL